jgi:hypothetical protein
MARKNHKPEEIVGKLRQVEVLIEQWRTYYNTIRPHSSFGYRPPAPEVILWLFVGCGCGGARRRTLPGLRWRDGMIRDLIVQSRRPRSLTHASGALPYLGLRRWWQHTLCEGQGVLIVSTVGEGATDDVSTTIQSVNSILCHHTLPPEYRARG